MNGLSKNTTLSVDTLYQLVPQIYRISQTSSSLIFKRDCLQSLSAEVPFDVGFWLCKPESKAIFENCDTKVFKPKDMVEVSPLLDGIITELNQHILNSSLFKFNQTIRSVYKLKLDNKIQPIATEKHFHIMTHLLTSKTDGSCHLIAIVRGSEQPGFTDVESDIFDFISPNLVNAWGIHRVDRTELLGSYRAVSDSNGWIIEADIGFFELMTLGLSCWDKRKVPIALDNSHCYLPIFISNEIVLITTYKDGNYYFEAVKRLAPLHKLTKKEYCVSLLLPRVSTAKNIASILNISPRTVDKYMSSIYEKLNTKSKSDTILLLMQVFYNLKCKQT